MSVATAAASAVRNRASEAMRRPGGLAAIMSPSTGAIKAARKKRRSGGVFGKVTSAVGGDNGRLDTIESRLDALEGGTEGDVTQPSPTVNVPSTPEESVGAAPALPEPTMRAAEEMFGGGAIRQIAAGAGKFKK